MKAKEIKEHIQDDWIQAQVIFELAGNPKEHIEETLREYMNNIQEDSRVKILEKEYADAKEQEDGVWSAFVETELLATGLDTLTWLAFNFMPASIEIIEPERMEFTNDQLMTWLNDLLAKLHEVNTAMVNEKQKSSSVTKSMNALIKNSILVCLDSGEKTEDEIQDLLGIHKDQLQPFFENLEEKGMIQKKEDKWFKKGD